MTRAEYVKLRWKIDLRLVRESWRVTTDTLRRFREPSRLARRLNAQVFLLALPAQLRPSRRRDDFADPAQLDRGNIGQAKLAGLIPGNHLVGNEFQVALTVFFVFCTCPGALLRPY